MLWLSNPTLDELVAFMKKHGVEKVDSITDEKSIIRHFRATSRAYKEERDEYKKQRDELINDIADIKRKAEAFDEIKANLYHVFDLEKYDTLDYKDCQTLREIFEEVENDLERGSDES